MSKYWDRLYPRYIDNIDVISVFVDSLVTYNQLLELLLVVSHNCDICIRYVQLCLVFQEEIEYLWIEFMELDQEYSTLALILICEQIEALSLRIVDNLFDV